MYGSRGGPPATVCTALCNPVDDCMPVDSVHSVPVVDGMTEREQWFCTNCGNLRFTAEQPEICEHCGRGTERAKHRVVGSKSTEFKRVVEERKLDSDLPVPTEECPGCGAEVGPEEITHELGGGYCNQCS